MKDTTGRHIRKEWLAAAACVAILAAVLLVRIFGGSGKAEEAEAASPQDVLSGFYSALISGQTDMLAEYCDTTASVMEYVENFISGTADMRGKEPGAFSIAAGMVAAGTEEKRKDRDGILLDFRLELRGSAQDTAGKDGPMVKEKTARMKTEGGKWVITDITGR